MRVLIAWLLAILAMAGTPALAELPARPQGPVLDQAGIIPDDQEAALDQRLRDYNKATGRAVIVATVSSLDGMDDAEYAQQLSEAWDIGGAETEEGVLLLVAPGERKMRIHNARGVQERLTDALSGRIIRDTMAPRFREKDFGGGISAGVDAIIAQLDRAPADAKAIAEAAATADGSGEDVGFGVVLFWIIVIVFFIWIFSRGSKQGRRRGSDPGVFIWGPGLGSGSGSWGGSDSGGGFGGFGGFGGGGGGFDGGGASGDW